MQYANQLTYYSIQLKLTIITQTLKATYWLNFDDNQRRLRLRKDIPHDLINTNAKFRKGPA